MGQYFIFVTSHGQSNCIPLPFNLGLTWTKIYDFDDEKLKEMIDYVIKKNGWEKENVLYALGDYGTVVRYNQTLKKFTVMEE